MSTLKVAWYNVENLFEPGTHPTHKSKWTKTLYREKVKNIASVIAGLFDDAGAPDLLGLCEIASDQVLQDIIVELPDASDYGIVHHDTEDVRLIDVGFIYRRSVLSNPITKAYNIRKRYPTRDILCVDFTLTDGTHVHVVGNHWPSRSGGQYASEPYRILLAENCSWVVDQLYQEDPDANIIVMGDFNDEPFNRSVQEYLYAIRNKARVTARRNSMTARPYLYNLAWLLMDGPTPGTFHYSPAAAGWNMLDQIMVSKAILAGTNGLEVDENSIRIYRPTHIRQGSKPKPFRKKRNGWVKGYSDHFPITVEVEIQ